MRINTDRRFNKEENKHGSYLLPYSIYKTHIPDYFTSFPLHWHEEIEIILVKSGCSKYIVDFKEYILNTGDILIIPPTSLHSFEQYEDKRFFATTVIFDQKMISGSMIDTCSTKYIIPVFNNEIFLPIHIKADDKHNKPLTDILESAATYHNRQPSGYELYLRICFLSFIHYFFENNLYDRNTDNTANTKTSVVIKNITTYIENHFSENITLNTLACHANISVFHLSHIFKRYTSQTPIEYLNHYRLIMAAQMLLSEDTSIINISSACGYNNVSYFNRSFKAKYGMTPKEYRRSKNS